MQRFGQHSSGGVSRRVYAEQGSERGREIDRFGVRPIDSRLKGETVEREWHMGIVRERRRVIGTFRASDLKEIRDTDDIIPTLRRIAMGIAAADFGGRNVSASEL